MDILEAIENRVSVRSFTEQALTEEEILQLAHVALRAPTAGNLLHYSVICVTDAGQKEIVSKECGPQQFINTAPLLMIFNMDENRDKKWIDKWGGHFHFDGPSSLLIAASDALIAAQNVVLAAEAMGLGSVYIGTVIGAAENIRRALGYPEYVVPVTMLCIGHPKDKHPKNTRFDVRAILHRERYQDFSDEDLQSIYGDWEAGWTRAHPEGIVTQSGDRLQSIAQVLTIRHYTEEIIRKSDEGMRVALETSGFTGFEKPKE